MTQRKTENSKLFFENKEEDFNGAQWEYTKTERNWEIEDMTEIYGSENRHAARAEKKSAAN